MSDLFRIEDEPVRTRRDYYQHVLGGSIVPFDVRIAAEHDPRAEILTGPVGPVHLTRVTGPPMQAFRTARLIRASDPVASWIDRRLPKPLQTFASLYGSWL